MRTRNFTLIFLCLFYACLSSSLFSQVTFGDTQDPQDINVCEADSLSFFRVDFTSSITVDSITIRMPAGVEYVPGSVTVLSGTNGLSLSDLDVSNPTRPVFAFNFTDPVTVGDFIEFSITKSGVCGAVEFSQEGNLANDTIGIWTDTLVAEDVTSNYNINYPSLFTSYVFSNDTIVNDLPSTVCRDIEIVNGGTGYISNIQHQVSPGEDLQNYELRYQGIPLAPVSTAGGTLTYEFDLSAPPFAGTFGAEDTILQNGESITIEECFMVNSCDFSDGDVTHQSFWGCGGEICQMGNVISGSVDLVFSQPDLNSDIDSLDNIVCMDGMDKGYIRMRVWNEGIGPSVLNRIALRANGANTSLDISGFSVVDEDGVDISSFFPDIESGTGASCGSTIDEYTLTNDDFESSYQLFPDDTVYVVMQYVLCCPGSETCGSYTLSNPFVELRGTDLCGQNPQNQRRSAGTGGTASAADPIVTGNSVLSGGDIVEFCAEYPNYQFLDVGDADSSFVTFMVELPEDGGLVFNDPMSSTFEIGGNAIPIESSMVVGDSLLVHVLLSDIEGQPNAPIKVCFELMAVCADGPGGAASLNLGQSTSIDCDPLCFIKLNCSSHDILLLGCGPGNCDVTGGGVINSYSVERISYGYVDAGDDRNWDDFVRADASDINVKRAMVGDTIRHLSELGFNAGSIISWDGGFYRETYTADWQDKLCPDTAWVEIIAGGNTYTIGGLVPVAIQNGFEYDLSVAALSALPGGNTLPLGFEFSSSDVLNLVTQYAFCKENAGDWLSIVPGVYRPANEQQNVIFTGNFEAIPAGGGDPIGCNEAYDEMLFLGAALSVDIRNGGFSGSGCDRDFRYLIEIEQNIGGVLSGYTGTFDFFPNEFRPLYIPDSIVVSKPADVTFKKAWLVTQQIENEPPPPHGEQKNEDIPLSLITETATDIILKVRDVHDAFGGSLFPYDEENADLRYYISFQRSCESPLSVTTDLSIAYTTDLCPGDEFETERMDLTTGTNSDLYDIDYIQSPVTRPANNDNTCFDLRIRPRGGNLSYTWLEFPENDSVTILSVSENGSVLTSDANGLYRLGAHGGNTTRTITICADLNGCSDGVFEVLHGWSCNDYPGEAMSEETCTYETLQYTIETVDSELQFNLVTQPSNSTPGNTPDFCAPLLYELVVNSANAGSVVNPRIEITLPIGFEINNITGQYPNGATAETMPFTFSGDTLIVDLTDHPAMAHDSLPGTATDVTPQNRQFKLQIYGQTNCDFRSGSQLYFTSYGERPCGGPVTGNGIRRASNRLFINELSPYEVNPNFDIEADQGVTCAAAAPVNVSFEVEGGDFTGLDSGRIILSPGLEFVEGSLVCNSTMVACPVIDRIVEDPNNPGGSLVYYSYDGNVVPAGQTIDFTFDVMAQESTSCGQMVNIQLENFVTIEGLMCGGMACDEGVTGITGVDTVEMEVIHPILDFSNVVGNTVTGSDYLEYTGTVTIDQKALSANDSLYVYVYCADAMGNPTTVIDSVLIHGPAEIGGTIDFTGYIAQDACTLDNGLVFSVKPIEGCLCTEPLAFLPFDEIEEVSREFDLALRKTVNQPTDLTYGDTLTFDIEIINQGDVWADSFEITDYIPAGLTYVADTNNALGWVHTAGVATRWLEGPLLPGADTTIQIFLRLDYDTTSDAYLNYAEISQDENPIEGEDIDSTPDDDPDNDPGGNPDSPSDDSVDGDGSGSPGDEDPETDEDDHDPALVKVADLALRKVMNDDTPGPNVYGDTLHMNIELINQGNVPVNYIEVTDYLPAGFTFIDDATVNPDWDGSDPTNPVYTWMGDTLYHADTDTIHIKVILSMVVSPDSSSWTNFSEISLARDTADMEISDIDSEADNTPDNDPGGQPDSPADNYVDGDGTGNPGDGVPETDEDDHDPLHVEVYDLALRKTINPLNDLPFNIGDLVILDITIFNQGNIPVQNVEITDYIPGAMVFSPMNSPGWGGTDPQNPVYTIADTLYPGQDTTVSITVELLERTTVDGWTNYAEISNFEDLDGDTPEDIDSSPDDEPGNDYGARPLGDTDNEISGDGKSNDGTPDGDDDPLFDEDDHDVAILDIVDLALIKVIDSMNSQLDPIMFGSEIKFDIFIQNQGNVVADSVRVKDYVPAGFAFDPGHPDNAAEGWQADSTVLLEKRLGFEEYDTVSLYLTLQSVPDPQMDSWINYTEIFEVYDTTGNEVGQLDYDSSPGSDSEEERTIMPGDDGDNDFMSHHRDSLGSEDDHDPAGVMFLDLALVKKVDSSALNSPIAYGDTIKFDIMVINQEGVMVDSVRLADYVPEGFHFDPDLPGNMANDWQPDTTSIVEGPVNVGDTVTTSIYLILLPNSVPTDRTWVNYSEILEAWNSGMEIAYMDIDSEPGSDHPEERETYPGHPGDNDTESIARDSIGSEDDHDPAFVEIFDLALIKTTEEEVAYPGLDVPFDITVSNQGGIPATNMEVTDYIPAGFTFNPTLNPEWVGSDPLVTHTITDTLYPGESIQVTIVLTVTDVLHPDSLVNIAEISAATDTLGMPREDIDGVFDDDKDNDPGGRPDSPADNYVDGDGSGTPGDGNRNTDEDNADPAKILPCLGVNCHAYINLAFNTDCEILVTPDMLLTDNRLAAAAPQFYEVELFYGPGIRIPDNILRLEHAGKTITARVTFLIEECGGGSCETTIALEKPNACIIRNTLDTAVYCTDPFLQLDPMDPAYPKPELINVCNGGSLTLEVSPDWVMVTPCDEASDTAEIIFREWTAITSGGARCSGVDTIVVYRLPKLTPESFIGTAEDSFYCELTPAPIVDGPLLRYASWKQPLGLHDYELPYSRLRGVTYELPLSIIVAGLTQAESQGPEALESYEDLVILRKANGRDLVTIGDIVSGDYMNGLIASATDDQKIYGFLQVLIELNQEPVKVILGTIFEFYPYLLLEIGDQVLSQGGFYVEVTDDWFFNGTDHNPYWFAGAWPSIYGSGSSISYHDIGKAHEFGCIMISVPYIDDSIGLDPDSCITMCLSASGPHCGINIEREELSGWEGSCPQSRGMDTQISQTCWAETSSNCTPEEVEEGNEIVVSYDSTAKKIEIVLSEWQTLIDTIGPIFNFQYLEEWDQVSVQESIRSGTIHPDALDWEREYPVAYRVNTHNCEAEILLPDVQVIDNCSGVHSIKAMVDGKGGKRVVALTRTSTSIQILSNGDTSYIHTYSHLDSPIQIPFRDCGNELIEVVYEASDNCWNMSTWSKFITISDDIPPTVVTNKAVTVTLDNNVAWAQAATFDEGSWDNCSVDLRLARRVDWLQSTAVSLCDNSATTPYSNWTELLADLGVDRNQLEIAVNGGTVGIEAFNNKYDVDQLSKVLNEGEIENHYFNQIAWLWTEADNCGKKVVHGWLFEIAASIGEQCSEADEHGNTLNIIDLERIFDNLMNTPGYGQEMAYLGGGWAQDVAFTCVDACLTPEVELLVMDQCCNFGIGSTTTVVNDKSQARVIKRLPDLDISCEAYNLFYKDIVDRAASLGENGSLRDSSEYFASLNDAFGRYLLTRVDNQNRPVGQDGQLLEDVDLIFAYRNVSCSEKSETVQMEVVNHDGTISWVNDIRKSTFLDTIVQSYSNGIISINCAARIVEDVWVDLDECGYGTIIRRFTIISGCGAGESETALEQVINVRPGCELRESMFDLPADIGTIDSPICITQSLSNNYVPDHIGAVVLKSHLTNALCNMVTIGKDVKELNVLDNAGMKKYIITWSVKDWCTSYSSPSGAFSYTQEVIASISEDCEDSGGIDTTGTSLVAGSIMTELNSPVQNVSVKSILPQSDPITIETSENGTYNFRIQNGSPVRIVPRMNEDFADGVSTADLIAIQRHVLNKEPLNGKYRHVAADINGNGIVEGIDVLELRKVVLNPNRAFSNNRSWRFFDSSTGKEMFEMDRIEEDMTVNFTATKIGDVDLSGDAATPSRSATGELLLTLDDRVLEGGEIYRLEVRSGNFDNIRGLQYTLQYSDAYIGIESIEPGALNVGADNFYRHAPGTLTASWSKGDGLSVSSSEVLFTIVIKAKKRAVLRDMLSLSHRLIRSEAYGGTGQLMDVALHFAPVEASFALYQNKPNPYNGETVIGFQLPENDRATITIFDVTGKMIKRIEGNFQAGYNEVRVTSIELGTTGVLYYQLDTDEFTATKKMVVME